MAVDPDDGLVLIDPLDPPAAVAQPAHALLTVFWHLRSAAARSPAARREGSSRSRPRGDRTSSTGCRSSVRSSSATSFSARAPSRSRPTTRSAAAPSAGLAGKTHADLRESLGPLLELPVERVLVSHGAPVLEHGKREVERLLG